MVALHDHPGVFCSFCDKLVLQPVKAGARIPPDSDFTICENYVYENDGTLDYIELHHAACAPEGYRPAPERVEHALGVRLREVDTFVLVPGMAVRQPDGTRRRRAQNSDGAIFVDGVLDLRDMQTVALLAEQARDAFAARALAAGITPPVHYAVPTDEGDGVTWTIYNTWGESRGIAQPCEGAAWADFYLSVPVRAVSP